jgi:hypothetical protein
VTTVKHAAEVLEAALKQIPDLRGHRDLGARVDPPAFIVGPPELGWSGYGGPEPTSARFVVWVVVSADDLALERLWELVPAVVAKVEELDDVTLADVDRPATPGTFPSGGSELPAYQVQVDYAL